MSHISTLFQALDTCNNVVSAIVGDIPETQEHTIFEVVEIAASDLAARVIAVAMSVIALICTAINVIPQAVMLNARLLIGPSAFLCILKANWAFLKVLLIGLGSPIGAIFFPTKVYGEWKMQEHLLSAIAEVLAQIPLDLNDLARGLRLNLDVLDNYQNLLVNFRGELEIEFAQSLIRADSNNIHSERLVIEDPDFMDFDYNVYQEAFHRLLLAHYSAEVVANAMPHYTPPRDEYRTARLDSGAAVSNFWFNAASTSRKDFSELLVYNQQIIAIEFWKQKLYAEDEFYIGGELYAALADRAVLNILETATLENNILVLHGKKDLQFTARNEVVNDMCKTFKALHIDIQKLALMPNEMRLLVKLLNRREKVGPEIVEIKPDAFKIKHDPKVKETLEQKAKRDKMDFVIKLFDGIVGVRTQCIDRRIMNTNNLSSEDTVDFSIVYEVDKYINTPEFNPQFA
jgi:hypothetical protein